MGNSSLYIFLFFQSVVLAYGQQQTYFVQFKDKVNSSYAVEHPENFLSSRAIERRVKCEVVIDQTDLPVSQNYIDQVIAAGAQLYYPLKWFNGVVVRSDALVKTQISSLSFVTSVDASVKFRKANPSAAQAVQSNSNILSSDFGEAYFQNDMLGTVTMHQDGYTGKGVLIAITDDGFLNVNTNPGFTTLFKQGQIHGTWDLVDLDTSLYQQGGGHGAEVFSILGGNLAGQFLGPATNAGFLLFRTEDVASESPLEELNWARAAEIADSAGADLIQVSLGYNTFDDASLDHTWSDLNGKSSYVSKAASIAYAKGIIVVASAGNEGASAWQKITCPADADGVVAVGAVDYDKGRSYFSSRGYSADGRIKPDVMAMGTGVVYITTNGTLASGSGTSFASPLISGLLAGLIEAYPSLTHKEMIESLKRSCDRYANPDSLYGYGIPNYAKASSYAKLYVDKESSYVFPNPYGSYLNMKVPASGLGQRLDWSLYSVEGKKISEGQETISGLVVSLWSDADTTVSGVYLLRVSIGGDFYTFRLIK